MTKQNAALWVALAALLTSGPVYADMLTENFYAAGGASVNLPPVFPLVAGGNFTALENFGGQPIQAPGPSFVTDFNTGGHVSGTYSGSFAIQPLGGPQHGGNAITSGEAGSFYTLTLTHGPDVPGINYFGLDAEALDPASVIQFLSGSSVVASVTGAGLLAGSAGSAFDVASPPVYVAFTDQSGFFDQVRFTGNGTFISDEHVVGAIAAKGLVDSVSVVEPASATMMGWALVAAGVIRRVARRRA